MSVRRSAANGTYGDNRWNLGKAQFQPLALAQHKRVGVFHTVAAPRSTVPHPPGDALSGARHAGAPLDAGTPGDALSGGWHAGAPTS